MRILNDVNYVIQKVPGGRLQICHVDRLLRYEGEPPQVWVRYDRENERVPPVPTIPENRSEPQNDGPSSPRLVGNGSPSTSRLQLKPRKKTRRINVRVTQTDRHHDKTKISEQRNWTKIKTVHQTGRAPDFYRNADNRPIT